MDFKNYYLGEWAKHDDISCNALREYEESSFKKTARLMQHVAEKHGTTIEEMKKHWGCLENH